MTGRERVIGAIERSPIDRVPKYDVFWEDTLEKYIREGLQLPQMSKIIVDGEEKIIGNSIEQYFDFDISCFYMDVSMRFPASVLDDDGVKITIEDRCGYTAQKFKNRASSMHFWGHKVSNEDDWNKYKIQFKFNPNDKARVDSEGYFLRTKDYPTWEGLKNIFDKYRKSEKFIAFFGYGPYEATWRHHGYENSLMDLISEPELMEDMFEKATDLILDTLQHMIDLDMKPDAMWLAEDLGGTHTTLFSPNTYRERLFPYHKKIGDFLHKHKIYFFMHSCGKIECLLPDLVEAGLDVIQALQANTGMNVIDLKNKYGDKLTFFGNISELAFRDGKESIEKELRSKIPKAMEGGGYIFHSDHSIPPEVDLDTYLYAMKILDEIGKY